uniref:Bestrophin homolog n=1 Tax=Syphacia muris TaxID=451379 RepID=A0A0N5AL26_9BILA
MTKNYLNDLATARVGTLIRILFRWKGGLWKSVYLDLIIWCIFYVVFALVYRLALSTSQQKTFEDVAQFLGKYEKYISVVFMLGFFVETVVNRWWAVIENMGITDDMSLTVSCYLDGVDETSVRYKRAIVRYMCLFQALLYRSVSTSVRKKFPNLESFVKEGYLLKGELSKLSEDEIWTPIQWSIALATKARSECLIKSDLYLTHIINTCEQLNTTLRIVWVYAWVVLPLAYSQVIFMVVRLYFAVSLISQQVFVSSDEHFDTYVPIPIILSFIFYFGWLKVAEALLNPFGFDDDDFDVNSLLERNKKSLLMLKKSLIIAEEISFSFGEITDRDDRLTAMFITDCRLDSG